MSLITEYTTMQIEKFQFITQFHPTISYLQQIENACKGGAKWISLRVKGKSYVELKKLSLDALALCRKYDAKLIINDNALLVKEIGADGVHLGRNDMPVDQARLILGKDAIIGRSANTFEEIVFAYKLNADYVALGPMRFTRSREHLNPVLGIEIIKGFIDQCNELNINIPIIATGGVLTDDVSILMEIGVFGVAAAAAITSSDNPLQITEEFIARTLGILDDDE